MRLIERFDDGTLRLATFLENDLPEYAILSHTWESDDQELTYAEFHRGTGRRKTGYRKIVFCGERAASDGLRYFWVDSCCIDKSSSAELSEAINSMFRWYEKAARCYVFLSDVSSKPDQENLLEQLQRSRWFTRGWTLQELLAPRSVQFFTRDGLIIGDKKALHNIIHDITAIDVGALQGADLSQFTVAQRMKWAENRQTKIEEDRIYCLLGIFQVFMPLIYGEGHENANRRLAKEIRNHSKATGSVGLDRDRKVELVESLRFDHLEDRETTIKRAFSSTCKWLLNDPKYHSWLDPSKFPEHHGILWIKGKPGVGKSTLMKFAYTRARAFMRNTTCVGFFFNARGEALEKDTTGMFRSLLYQLFVSIPEIQDVLDELSPIALPRQGSSDWSLETLMELLILITQSLDGRRVQIYVDALDECDEDQIREMVRFFEDLGESAITQGAPLLICFSSRHYPHDSIDNKIELILEGEEQHSKDIEIYVRSHLRIGKSLESDDIRAELLRRSAGIFIWIVLVVQILNKAYDHGHLHALREKLKNIPDDLGELFASILTHDDQNMAEMRACILCILFSSRPLTKPELFTAIRLATGPDEPASPPIISEANMESFILSASKGLTEFTQSLEPTAQFIHESVRDFLFSDTGKKLLWPRIESELAPHGHKLLQRCCILFSRYWIRQYDQYMPRGSHGETAAVDTLRHLSQATFSPQKQPFLHYALFNLFQHAEKAELDGLGVENILKIPVRLLISLGNVVFDWRWSGGHKFESDSTMLYILAEYDCPNLIRTWIDQNPLSIDPEGGRHGSPLRVALLWSNEAAIRALLTPSLDRGAHFSPPSAFEVSEMIAFYKSWVSKPLKRPLIWSSWLLPWFFLRNANENIVLAVLRSGHFDLSATDPQLGRTPLSYASERGLIRVIQFILMARQGTSIHGVLGSRITQNDVKALTLCKSQAFPPRVFTGGQTPLFYASTMGHALAVKILAAQSDAQVNHRDSLGLTPLIHAAKDRNHEVVTALLGSPDINVELRDKSGKTALAYAAFVGDFDIAMSLMRTGAADSNKADLDGRIPISLAAQRGHSAIVELLLSNPGIDISIPDKDGRTALFYAASNGNLQSFESILKRQPGAVSDTDSYGQSLLHASVISRNLEITKYLLALREWDVHSTLRDDVGSLLVCANYSRAFLPLLWEHCGCADCISSRIELSDLMSSSVENNQYIFELGMVDELPPPDAMDLIEDPDAEEKVKVADEAIPNDLMAAKLWDDIMRRAGELNMVDEVGWEGPMKVDSEAAKNNQFTASLLDDIMRRRASQPNMVDEVGYEGPMKVDNEPATNDYFTVWLWGQVWLKVDKAMHDQFTAWMWGRVIRRGN